MPRLEGICISVAKGTVKRPVPCAELVAGHGLAGDAHAGDWHRQVSLLASESIAEVKRILPTAPSPRTSSPRAWTGGATPPSATACAWASPSSR